MTRSPVASLRRLYAVGGAPAASHVVLSRAPGTERLLEPLARARVAHETSLDALARPIDVGGVLSRVAEAASNVRRERAETATDAAARRTPRARKAPAPVSPPATMLAGGLSRPVPVVPSRARANIAGPSEIAQPRPSVALKPDAVVDEDYLKRAAGGVETSIPRRPQPSAAAGRVMPRPGAAASTHAVVRAFASPDAAAGANARVLVAPNVAEVERLLAVAAPLAPTAVLSTHAAPRDDRSVEAAVPADASRLLASAVARVQGGAHETTARRARPLAPSTRNATIGRELQHAPEPNGNGGSTLHAPDTESVGGFRGLAQRTLVSDVGARAIPVRRIEPETRTSIDLATDTLDARVADSLARVLEREARRHGIDLAEARA